MQDGSVGLVSGGTMFVLCHDRNNRDLSDVFLLLESKNVTALTLE